MQRASSAKSDEHKVPRIVATLHGDEAHGAHHVGIGNLDNAMSRLQGIEPQRLGALAHDSITAHCWIEGHFTAQEKRRVQPAQQQIGIRNRRRGAPLVVTGRTRHCPGAARSDTQRATRIDPGFTAAAGPDFHQVDHRRAHWVPTTSAFSQRRDGLAPDLELRRQFGLAVLDQAHLGGCATHIE